MTYGTYSRLHIHVSDSPRAVIEAARRKLRPNARAGRASREARHAFYRAMLGYHTEAQRILSEWRL